MPSFMTMQQMKNKYSRSTYSVLCSAQSHEHPSLSSSGPTSKAHLANLTIYNYLIEIFTEAQMLNEGFTGPTHFK